jgi:formylglycine-generating enzyme required for sulfatase activity
MGSNVEGGITRSGTGSGPYTYTIKSGMANMPVVDVTWFDTLRFANWLNNGQGNGSTEIGSYTLLGGTPTPSNASTISRNAGAQWVLPSENEWYKAAYYDPTLNSGSGGYWLYPTRNNTAPVNILSSTGTNNANFYDDYGTGTHGYTTGSPYLTDVGAFAASPGPYGTFDQGGDVWQWNETDIFGDGSSRGLRGGGWHSYSIGLASSYRDHYYPTYEGGTYIGFRVASVPEPGSLIMTAMIAVTGLLYYWRKHA